MLISNVIGKLLIKKIKKMRNIAGSKENSKGLIIGGTNRQ